MPEETENHVVSIVCARASAALVSALLIVPMLGCGDTSSTSTGRASTTAAPTTGESASATPDPVTPSATPEPTPTASKGLNAVDAAKKLTEAGIEIGSTFGSTEDSVREQKCGDSHAPITGETVVVVIDGWAIFVEGWTDADFDPDEVAEVLGGEGITLKTFCAAG